MKLSFPAARRFDLACLGRLAVDLYAEEFGAPLEDAAHFARYLGGSSANIAFGAARLGLSVAMISRVGDEQMGRFLVRSLQREGCDTSMVQVDPQRLSALVLLGLKDTKTFPLLFYRENCADMALEADGISEAFIAQCRALLITGTHLSTEKVLAASQRALHYAQTHQVTRILDIDYRPVLWGLTGRGEGERRYVASAQVTDHLQKLLPQFDLLIGTEEEFLIAGGKPGDLIGSLRAVRQCTHATLVVKLGALGCAVIEGEVPSAMDQAPTHYGKPVQVFNVLGAGDAFAAGLMYGLLSGVDMAEAARYANACGALVVTRHACAPAMPTRVELDYWLSAAGSDARQDETLRHLHRTTIKRPAWPCLHVLAFDHRQQFFDLARSVGAEENQLMVLKQHLVTAVEVTEKKLPRRGSIGVLIDDTYGRESLAQVTGRGWWLGKPVELPGSLPLQFDRTRSIATLLRSQPLEQVVKCLVYFDPDDELLRRLDQETRLLELWEATRASGHELLLEVIPTAKNRPGRGRYEECIVRAIKRLYNLGLKPEWWKLPPMAADGWHDLAQLIQSRDPYCRGVAVLGLNQPLEELARTLASTHHPIVKGFMVGRSIWGEPSRAWLAREIDSETLIRHVSDNFMKLIEVWERAHP